MQRFAKILDVNDPPDNSGVALQRPVQLTRTNLAQLTITNLGEAFPRPMSQLQMTFTEQIYPHTRLSRDKKYEYSNYSHLKQSRNMHKIFTGSIGIFGGKRPQKLKADATT